MKEKAIKKLTKEFEKSYSLDRQQQAEFFIDKSDEKTYTWTFRIEGRLIELIYVFKTGIVVKCIR